MSISDEQMKELSTVIKETGEKLFEDYYAKFCEILGELGLFDPIGFPLELWLAFAQAFADASGYRIVLQAAVLELIDGEPGSYRSVGQREMASADPTCFMQSAEE
jgi:hypothetical protein